MEKLFITIAIFFSALVGYGKQTSEPKDLNTWFKMVISGSIQPFSFDIGKHSAQLDFVEAKDFPGDKGWQKAIIYYREKNYPLTVELTCEFPQTMDMIRTTLTLKTNGPMNKHICQINILDLIVPKYEANVFGQTGGWDEWGNANPPKSSVPWFRKVVDDMPIELDAGNDGRSSNEQLPIWLYAENDGGIWYGPEWSGCWHMSVRSNSIDRSVQIGLPSFDFIMKEKETITLPSAAFGPYQGSPDDGFNQLRRNIYRYYLPLVDGKKPQPFVYWQGYRGHPTYATEEELYQEVDRAAQIGCEVFCLDGGWNMLPGEEWFWTVGRWDDQRRFTKGVKSFGEYVKSKGMKFGIWIEPRAVKGSQLHDKNPDLFYPGDQGLIRLDLPGGQDLFRGVFEQLIRDYGVDWVWLDFNVSPRKDWWNKMEPAGQKGLMELGFYQGWYKVIDDIFRKYPGLWIESCAGGGRMTDLRQLRSSQSIWVADDAGYDNTNRNRRHGLNLVLPAVYIQSSIFLTPDFVFNAKSDVPLGGEHRFLTFFSGSFGFGQGLPFWKEEDIMAAAKYTLLYKKYRHYLEGDYYNLLPMPFAWNGWDACQYHDPETQSGILLVYRLEDNKQAEMTISPRITGKAEEYNWSVIAGDTKVQIVDEGLLIKMEDAPDATLIHYQQKLKISEGEK